MTARTALATTTLAALVVALLASVYVAFEQRAYRRRRSYRADADAWDAAGPRWRWWVLIGSVAVGLLATAAREAVR